MKTSLFAILFGAVFIVGGCEKDKTEELQGEISRIHTESSTLQQEIASRDKYIDEIMGAVSKVYSDLEMAKSKESKLIRKTLDAENAGPKTSEEVRKAVLEQIAAIHVNLKDNRRRLAGLQKKLNESEVKYTSLDEMVRNLQETLNQRERSIAVLEASVKGLENTVAENQRVILQKEEVIEGQKHLMNTVYYIIGKEKELEERGIISDEGGILWGMLGSTTILSSGVDPSHFRPFDVTSNQSIRVEGKVKEIIPRRSEEFFSLAHNSDASEDLMITRPDKFWQDRYLVIVVD